MEIKDEHMAKLLLVYASEGTTLVCTDQDHYKFWNIVYNNDEGTVVTTWGRIGYNIQSSKKSQQPDPQYTARNLINSKLKKGYEIFSQNQRN